MDREDGHTYICCNAGKHIDDSDASRQATTMMTSMHEGDEDFAM